MFDKNLSNVKKFQRLKNLKKTTKIKKILFFIEFFNEIINFKNFNFNTLF